MTTTKQIADWIRKVWSTPNEYWREDNPIDELLANPPKHVRLITFRRDRHRQYAWRERRRIRGSSSRRCCVPCDCNGHGGTVSHEYGEYDPCSVCDDTNLISRKHRRADREYWKWWNRVSLELLNADCNDKLVTPVYRWHQETTRNSRIRCNRHRLLRREQIRRRYNP